MRKNKAFVIADMNGNLYLSTIRKKQSTCVSDFEKEQNVKWRNMYLKGWKCLKIEITVIERKGS